MRASCPRWTVLAASRVKVAADGVELIWGEGRFDPPEDRSLFVANVLTEQLAEFVEDFGFRVWRAVELGDAATDVRVLGQDALDVRVVRAGVFRQGGEEQFFFEAKVFAAFGAPEGECRLPDRVGLSLVGSFQAQGDFQGDVVLA